jgi:general secretion pathway protein A
LHGSAVLLIDEAQHLSADVLEEIRVLSNLETNDQKLLQIVIVGQLNLLDVLHKAELRQLDQRISIRCSLKALTREEVEAYVTHRLWVARGSTSVSFTPKAFDLVHALSGGVPRVINLLCDRSLMIACEKQTSRIAEEHVVHAAGQLGQEIPKGKIKGERADAVPVQSRRTLVLAATLMVVLLAAAVFFLIGNPLEYLEPDVTPAPPRVEQRSLPAVVAPLPEPAGMPVAAPPPPMAGSFSVLIGTYDSARQVELAERALTRQKLPVYTIDVLMAPGDLQRRVLVGRYATREEAEKVRAAIGGVMMSLSRVIPGEQERLRAVP